MTEFKDLKDKDCYPLTNSEWQELSSIAYSCSKLVETFKSERVLKADDEFIDGEDYEFDNPDYSNLMCLEEIRDKLLQLEEQWKHCQG